MKTSVAIMLVLSIFTVEVAKADCITQMVIRADKVARTERNLIRTTQTGKGVVIGSLLVSILFPVSGIILLSAGLGTFVVAGTIEAFNHQESKMGILNAVILHAKGIYDDGFKEYDSLRSRIQKLNPEISDEQIKNAIIIGDRDERLCPMGRAVSEKRMSKIIARIVTGN